MWLPLSLRANAVPFNAQLSAYALLIADKQDELEAAQARLKELTEKHKARIRAIEEDGGLSYWAVLFQAKSFTDLLGRFYMIHRPHRLTDIMVYLRQYKLEPKRIRFVQPYADKEPTMVLVEAARGGKPWVKVDAPLVIYKAPNEYTEEIYEIYYGKGQA